MSATPAGASSDGGTYIRAGGGVEINPRRLANILIWIVVALLVAFSAYYGVAGAQENGHLNTLRHKGVPVSVTVTGCVGISSGVGMGIEYWQCSGSYALGAQTFNEVIRGSRRLLDAGQRIDAIAVPGQPSLLSTVSSVRGQHSSTADYIACAVLGAIGVVLGAGWFLFHRTRRSSSRHADRSGTDETPTNGGHGRVLT